MFTEKECLVEIQENSQPMPPRSILPKNDMARRKRSRSPAVMPIAMDTEEPNRKLMCLRNMDIEEDGKGDYSWANCPDLRLSPELRQNGMIAAANQVPQSPRQINGVMKKKTKHVKKGKGRKRLRNNFQLLKQEMEPIQVVDYLKGCGAVDNALHRKTVDGKWRSERVDTLIKGLLRLMNDENEDKIFVMIIDALDKSRQTELSLELQKEPNSFHPGETELMDENNRLLQFFKKTKEKLKEVLDPRKVLEEIFDLQGLDLDAYEEIKNEPRRKTSVDILFKTLESRHGKEWQILRPVYNWYKNNSSECESNDKAETASSSSHESTELKVCYQPVIAQDASEHTDPHSKLKELQLRIVQNANENGDQFDDLEKSLIDECASKLKQISFSSINLHLQPLTDKSLQKLIECCKGEEVKQWIISILSEDDLKTLKELKATTVTVNVYVKDLHRDNKYKLFDEVVEGCLCMISKDWLRQNRELFEGVVEGLETKVICTLLNHNTLQEDMEDVLQIRRSTEHLVNFLCKKSLPEVSYCFIENDVLKNDRRDFISQLRQENSNTTDCVRVRHISNCEIKEHKELLEEELDANWFVSCLKARGDKASKDMVEVIEHSSSRRDRTRQFVRFLCEVDDKEIDWFAEILQQNHKHLFQVLQPEILTNVSEIRHGLLSVFDYLTEELDPEEFIRSLKASSHEKLECAQLQHLRNKREKSVRFLSNLLKKENSNLVPEVVNAMKTYSGDIYNTLQQVLKKGSLDEHYRCPMIEKESLKRSKCCFKTTISLAEDDEKEFNQDEPLQTQAKAINQDSTPDKYWKHITINATEVPEPSKFTHEPTKSDCQYSYLKRKRKRSFSSSDPNPNPRKRLKSNTFDSIAKTTNERNILTKEMRQRMLGNSIETKYIIGPMRKSSEMKPFQCHICKQQFLSKLALTEHRSRCLDERPYQCPLCQKCFRPKSSLRRHVYRHKDTLQPSICPDCQREFASRSSLALHRRRLDALRRRVHTLRRRLHTESDLREPIKKLQTSDKNNISDNETEKRSSSEKYDVNEPIQKLQTKDPNSISDKRPGEKSIDKELDGILIPKMYKKNRFRESCDEFMHNSYMAGGEGSSTTITRLRPERDPRSQIGPPQPERRLFGSPTNLKTLRHDLHADLAKYEEEFKRKYGFSLEKPTPPNSSSFLNQSGCTNCIVESDMRNQSYKNRNASALKHLDISVESPYLGVGNSSKATKRKYSKLPKMEKQPEDQLETNAVFQSAT